MIFFSFNFLWTKHTMLMGKHLNAISSLLINLINHLLNVFIVFFWMICFICLMIVCLTIIYYALIKLFLYFFQTITLICWNLLKFEILIIIDHSSDHIYDRYKWNLMEHNEWLLAGFLWLMITAVVYILMGICGIPTFLLLNI